MIGLWVWLVAGWLRGHAVTVVYVAVLVVVLVAVGVMDVGQAAAVPPCTPAP